MTTVDNFQVQLSANCSVCDEVLYEEEGLHLGWLQGLDGLLTD